MVVWFLFVQGLWHWDPPTPLRAEWLVSIPVNRSEMVERIRWKEGARGAGFHWDFWEALRIPPSVVNPRDRSLHCLLNLRLTHWHLVEACHMRHMDSTGFWGKGVTRVCLGGMMSFSTAMAGIRHEPKGCDRGHQVSSQGWQICKWHLYWGRAQVWFCPRAKQDELTPSLLWDPGLPVLGSWVFPWLVYYALTWWNFFLFLSVPRLFSHCTDSRAASPDMERH